MTKRHVANPGGRNQRSKGSKARNSPSAKFSLFRRKLKGKRVEIPEEAKARILHSVRTHETHQHLDPEDWAIPSADNGARRVVFESTYGPVSSTSEVFRTCADPECVSPQHSVVENLEARERRLSGPQERMVVYGNQLIPASVFEADLVVPQAREAWKAELKELEKVYASSPKDSAGNLIRPYQHPGSETDLGSE